MEEPASEKPATEEEAQRFAEDFADILLAESEPNIGRVFLASLQNPKFADAVARQSGHNKEQQNWYKWPEAKRLRVALEKRDRSATISAVRALLGEHPANKNEMELLLRLPDILPPVFREGFRQAAKKMFPAKPGPTPKAKRQEYPTMAQLGEKLAPLCQIVLAELQTRTKHTVKEILDFRSTDYPTETAFLLKHLARFESALVDRGLANRAKRLGPRACLIADVMAGAEYGFELRTSLERAREGRRMSKKKFSQ